MNKKIFYIIVFASVNIVFFVLFMPHRDKARFTQAELNWISDNSDEIFFMGYYDTPGEERFAKKLCEIISADTGLKIVPYEDTWSNTMKLLKKGRIPMCATMNISEERSEYLIFSSSLRGIESGVFSRMNNPIKSYEDIDGKTIGVIRNSYLLNDFMDRYPKIKFDIVYYDSTEEFPIYLKNEEIDGFLSTRDYQNEMRNFYYFNIPSISTNNNHIGIYKDNVALASIISKEVEYLNKINWSGIIKEAISFELEKQAISFTDEEKEFIAVNPYISVGLIEDYAPFSYKKDYISYGITPNILKKISYLTNINFGYVVDSYENIVNNENIDLITNITYKNSDYSYSSPLFTDKLVVVAKSSKDYIEEAYELEQYRVGISSFNYYNNFLKEQMPFMNLKKYNSFEQMFFEIEDGKRDYIIVSKAVADIYIKKYPRLDFRGSLYENFHYIIAKDRNNAVLTSILDKCLKVIDVEAIKLEEINKLTDFNDNETRSWVIVVFIVMALGVIIVKLYFNKRRVELRLMYTDQNTGVYNRLWLEKQLERKQKYDLFFEIELKNLVYFYERYGQQVYDSTVKKIVRILREHLKEDELFANVDKERFIIAKAYTSDSDTKKFAQNLSSLFKEKVYVHDLNYGINTYVGVLKADDDIRGVSDITNALEVALYYSKIENTVVYYSYDIYQKYNTQISFDKQFVNTIMNEELEVYYQPVFSKGNGELFAFNTHINCTLRDYGQVNSKSFNNGIKKLGLEIEVDKIKLIKVVRQIINWEKEGRVVCVLIGISPIMVREKNFAFWFKDITKEISKSRIIIKLNQEAFESNIDKLMMINSKNISFAIDKFGDDIAGVLEYDEGLAEIAVIDTEFLINLTEGRLHEDILDFVIAMGNAVNKKVMINGIVSKNQLDILYSRNVDYISGGYLKPYVDSKEVSFEGINS